MTYKKKVTVLAGVIAALGLVYIFSFVFDSDNVSARSSAYSWLDQSQKNTINRITISNPDDTTVLVQRNGEWFVSQDGKDLPARQLRVTDLINALTKRAPSPIRSSSSLSHEKLSLTSDSKNRITVAGGTSQILLDLIIGYGDLTGQNIYLRRMGQNEVRSGEDLFSSYLKSTPASWYNLLLFPESETGKLDITSVQRLTVYHPAENSGEVRPLIFTRRNRTWTLNVDTTDPDSGKVDSYISEILNTSGEGFADVFPTDLDLSDCRILMELGDGSIKTLRMGPPDEENQNRRFAAVSGSNLVYAVPGWTVSRLFPDISTLTNEK
jgi:hypothetical protein